MLDAAPVFAWWPDVRAEAPLRPKPVARASLPVAQSSRPGFGATKRTAMPTRPLPIDSTRTSSP